MAHAFVHMAASSSLCFFLAFHALKTTGMIILGANCTKDKGMYDGGPQFTSLEMTRTKGGKGLPGLQR